MPEICRRRKASWCYSVIRLVRDVQPLKARAPISVTVAGIVTWVSAD